MIKICARCHKEFEAPHGKRKYCKNCRRFIPAERANRYRQRRDNKMETSS